MLDSVPGPILALFWPLAGAAIVLMLGRLLPNWIRRLLALVAALASLAVLWSLRTGESAPVEIYWEPLNFFRMSPTLYPDGLALLAGLTFAGITAATVLGIRGSDRRSSAWHGLILVALAGCLVVAMATNLLALVLGSALIDLALIAMAISARNDAGRVVWRFVVPGAASTLVLLFGALQMDIQVGNASLSVGDLPVEVAILLGLAGVLRLMVFPLHPRGLNTPENAATLLLPIGAGIYLLARVQVLAPTLAEKPWMLTIGGLALLAGGFLAWTGTISPATQGGRDPEVTGPDWFGIAIHQTGYALAFVILLGRSVPWPLLSLTLALATLAIWWDSSLEPKTPPSRGWLEGIAESLELWWNQAKRYVTERAPVLQRWRQSWFMRHGAALLPTVALVSLAGAPFTVGAVGRWSFYATLLHERQATLLIVVLIADALLTAGLWIALAAIWKQGLSHRLAPSALMSMIVLAALLVAVGITPGALLESLGLRRPAPIDVSAWGLGLVFVLPWLVGGWLARVGARIEEFAAPARRVVGLDWLYGVADWVGQRLIHAVGWLGKVGEGEGWWGWVLVILALGAMFLALR